MKRKIMVIGMAGSALKSVTDKLESDGNEVKVVDDLDNVPEILKGKYYEETRTVLASESIEIKQADELLTQLRIKAANEIKITERELYDVQMLLCKAIDSLPPSKETDKSEAVDFTEWIRLLSPKIYKHVGGEKPHYYNGKYYTTQELYSIYKQSKTK